MSVLRRLSYWREDEASGPRTFVAPEYQITCFPWAPATNLFTALILFLSSWILISAHRHLKHKRVKSFLRNQNPFRFLDLPAELRELVYEELLEDPYYPPRPFKAGITSSFSLSWNRASMKKKLEKEKKGSWILLANKQVHGEFMDILGKKRTYHLTVSPENYHPTPTPPASGDGNTSTIPSSSSQSPPRLWNVSPQTLSTIRSLTLKLITTSSMLGVRDPRDMTPSTWALARQVRAELSPVSRVKELNLHIKAVGDPLWNPLWVWYHAACSFKDMGVRTSPTSNAHPILNAGSAAASLSSGVLHSPIGPKVSRITFSLDSSSFGENYLARSNRHGGRWAWYCGKDHFLVLDLVEPTVREFCAKLFIECGVCAGDETEEEEGDDMEEEEEDYIEEEEEADMEEEEGDVDDTDTSSLVAFTPDFSDAE